MIPPDSLDPLFDSRDGYTKLLRSGDLVWLPSEAAGKRRQTTLLRYEVGPERTCAEYRLELSCCPVVAWFDNATGARIDGPFTEI